MDIVFLSGIFPKERENEFIQKSKGAIQYAANAHQWALIRGLDANNNTPVSLINAPFVGDFPRHYSGYRIPSFHFSHINDSKDYNAGFSNIFLFNLFSKYFSILKILLPWSKRLANKKVIIIYGLFPYFLKAATTAKRHNPNIKLCVIVPDLPEFMGGNMKRLHIKLWIFINNIFIHSSLKYVDSFVILTEPMKSKLKIGNRPYIRVEGLYDELIPFTSLEKETDKTIMYSGNLNRSHGILDLLSVFQLINKSDYRLWISGEGSEKTIILDACKKDNRIIYWPKLTREELAKLQSKATVLINLRKNDSEAIKYFFPSKTLEYMASGTPCIIRKLPCIPDEYYKYTFAINDETSTELATIIQNICEKPKEELSRFGALARNFILDKKNSNVQCERICEMLKKL